MFQRREKTKDAKWEEIEEKMVRHNLQNFYKNLDNVIEALKGGAIARSHFAEYRWIEGDLSGYNLHGLDLKKEKS